MPKPSVSMRCVPPALADSALDGREAALLGAFPSAVSSRRSHAVGLWYRIERSVELDPPRSSLSLIPPLIRGQGPTKLGRTRLVIILSSYTSTRALRMNFGGLGVAEHTVHRLWVEDALTTVTTMNVDSQGATEVDTTSGRPGVLTQGRLLHVFWPTAVFFFLFLRAGRLQRLKPQRPVDPGFPFSRTMDYER